MATPFKVWFVIAVYPIISLSGLQVPFDLNGHYKIVIDGETWLPSAPSFLHHNGKRYSTNDGSLKLIDIHTDQGYDVIGYWNETILSYQILSRPDLKANFTVKMYEGQTFAIFSQYFTTEIYNTSTGDKDSVTSGFPSFQIDQSLGLGYLAHGGIMVGDTYLNIGQWGKDMKAVSGLDSGPLILFNHDDDALIITTFKEFMSGSNVYNKTIATWGVMGSVDLIPKDFEYSVIAYHSRAGIRNAYEGWGHVMRKFYGRDQQYRQSDLINNYLGYWTDNGAYYYYKTEDGLNYQDTLLQVNEYSKAMKIPYRYYQLDSWFYPKDPEEGVISWVAMEKIFPNGLEEFHKKLGLPFIAHNRWWSDKNVYAKQNGGNFTFVLEPKTHKAMPVEQQFWDFLMKTSNQWGLLSYEQDWLNKEFDDVHISYSNVTIGRQWLIQMGKGAQRNGVTLQYCMAPSRAILQAFEIPTVSNARVSDDYQPGNNNWQIGYSSMLAHAIGVAPFKDNFWSTSYQPGNPYNKSEPYPALHAVISSLSTGPVGIGDKIHQTNVSLVMKSCTTSGLLLKPSRPAFAVNAQIKQKAFKDGSGPDGHVYTTYSEVSGMRFGIILAADLPQSSSYALSWSEADIADTRPNHMAIVYRIATDSISNIVLFDDSNPLILKNCTKANFCISYTAPKILFNKQQLFLLGELQKWVPMATQRVKSITISTHDVRIDLNGAEQEIIIFSYALDNAWFHVKCIMNSYGLATLSIKQGGCLD